MKKFYLLLIIVSIFQVANAQNPFGNITDSISLLPCSDGSNGLMYLKIDSAGSYTATNLTAVFSHPFNNYTSLVKVSIIFGVNTIEIKNLSTNIKDTIQITITANQSIEASYYNNDSAFCQLDFDLFPIVLSSSSLIIGNSSVSVLNPSYFNSNISAYKSNDTIFFDAFQIADTGKNNFIIQAISNTGCVMYDSILVYKIAAQPLTVSGYHPNGNIVFYDGISEGIDFCGDAFFKFSLSGADSVWASLPLDTMLYVADFDSWGYYSFCGKDLSTGCLTGNVFFEATPFRRIITITENVPIIFPIDSTTYNHAIDSQYINFYIKDGYSCDANNSYSSCAIAATIKDIADSISLENVHVKVFENYKPFTKNGILQLSRYFEITPDVQAPAQVTLYFSQEHFNQFDDRATLLGATLFNADTTIGNFAINIIKVNGGLYGSGGAVNNIAAIALWNTVHHCWAVTFNVVSFSVFYITQAISPLSIGTVLQGYGMPNGNQLQWQNSAGNAVQSTNIECSLDGNTWQKCAINVDANGSYFHATLSNKMLYRTLSYVSTTDYYYSNSIVLEKKSPNAIIISPNPIVDNLFVNIAIAKNSAVQIRIVDAMGKEVATKSTATEIGMHKIQIPLSNISTGLYTAMIFVNDELVYIEKISKQ